MEDKSSAKKAGEELWSLAEGAKKYGVSHSYLRFLIFKKKLKAVRVGRNWATSKQWLDEFFSVPKINIGRTKVVLDTSEVVFKNKEQIDFSVVQNFPKPPAAVQVKDKKKSRFSTLSKILPGVV